MLCSVGRLDYSVFSSRQPESNCDYNLQEIESLKKTLPTSGEQSKLLQDCKNADTITCISDDVSDVLNHTKLYVRYFFSSLVISIWRDFSERLLTDSI